VGEGEPSFRLVFVSHASKEFLASCVVFIIQKRNIVVFSFK
jgi:hypothetical protein